MEVTDREYLCLQFLDPLLSADAYSIGRYIFANQLEPAGSNLSAIGAAVAGRLRKRGLVTYLPDIEAWRITRAGRDALTAFGAV
jgi:hypothetical protein